jgi:NitT/TauT family transport system substrate-binding protein
MELDHPGIHRVFNSVDVIGKTTVIMAYMTRRFHDANPKLAAAFVAALKEATDFATQNKEAAARIYVEGAKAKTSLEETMRILNDPDTHFSITPEGVMTFADFMHRVGIMRVKPDSWSDVFFPEVRNLPGS